MNELLYFMNSIVLVNESVTTDILQKIAASGFGNLVKTVVDVRRKIMAIGGEMHSDEEQFLIERGSSQDDLWGINIYPDLPREVWIEFDSMINIRPRQNNRTRSVDDIEIRERIIDIINFLVKA